MQRRLEDVSHFFLDQRSSPAGSQVSRGPQRAERRARVVYLTGMGEDFTTAVVGAALAASAVRAGRRVLVGETREQPFGVAFGLLTPPLVDGSPVVEAAPGLWVLSLPLLGASRPGALFDPLASAEWHARVAEADVVLVHLSLREAGLRISGMPVPNEFLVVEGEGEPEGTAHAYRAVKRAVSANPAVAVGLIAIGGRDERSRRLDRRLAKAVATFLERDCPTVGSIPNVSALSDAFMLGEVWRRSGESAPVGVEIVSRWPVHAGLNTHRKTLEPDDLTPEEADFFVKP